MGERKKVERERKVERDSAGRQETGKYFGMHQPERHFLGEGETRPRLNTWKRISQEITRAPRASRRARATVRGRRNRYPLIRRWPR